MPYQPLCHSKNEIRLLRVHPESTIGLISCDLFHVSLDASPPFLAISYAWGPSLRNKKVLVNGELHTVTASCWDVLHANTSLLEYQGMPIWIDAICINQEDEWERETEVLRMHWIYRRGHVAVNLVGGLRGREMKIRDRKAVRALELLAGRRSRESQSLSWKTVDEVSSTSDAEEEEIDENEVEDYISSSLSHIIGFLNNPWFSRTWIIQEFTLGLKTPDAPLLGHRALISASTLVAACIELAHRSNSLPVAQKRALLVGISRYLRLAHAAVMQMQGNGNSDLLRLLCMFRDQMASDARDKVYSLLGLFQAPTSASLAYDTHVLPVDYTATLETVYARTVQSIVLATRRLDILCACQHRSSFARSWTPDWRQPWRRTSLNPYVGTRGKSSEDWSACASREAHVTFSEDLRTVRVRGVVYAEVQAVGKKWSNRSIDDMPNIAEEVFSLTGQRIEYEETNEEGGTQFCDADYRNESGTGTRDTHILCRDLTCAMAATCGSLMPASDNPLHFLPHTNAVWFERGQRSNPLTAQFIKVGEGRRTMRTSLGSFGLGPEDMEVGDVVVVFFGCCVPVVLRPKQRCYEFVGECFVAGIMAGAVVEGLERGEVRETEFDLR